LDLKNFILALLGDWVSLMSGIASVVLTIIGAVRRWQQVPRWVLWVAAASCFLVASTRVWTTEHVRADRLQNEMDQSLNPRLECSIEQLVIGYRAQDSLVKEALALLVVTIRNKGAPSAAEQYTLQATGDNGLVMDSYSTTITDGFPWTLPDREFRLMASQALYSKTIDPIPHNGRKQGYLLFFFHGIGFERLAALGRIYRLTFKDGQGNSISCETRPDQSGPTSRKDFPDVDKP